MLGLFSGDWLQPRSAMSARRLAMVRLISRVIVSAAEAQNRLTTRHAVNGVYREDRGQQESEDSRRHASRTLSGRMWIRKLTTKLSNPMSKPSNIGKNSRTKRIRAAR